MKKTLIVLAFLIGLSAFGQRAKQIKIRPIIAGITATNVHDALAEIQADIDNLTAGGSDGVITSVTYNSGTNTLTFTGVGGAHSGSIVLSGGGGGGANGLDGKTILNGTVNPTTQGVDGDFYINTSTFVMFGPKNTTWGTGTPIVGPTGPAGANGQDGAKGDKGDTGDTGPAGPQGPAGSGNGSITVDDNLAISDNPIKNTGVRNAFGVNQTRNAFKTGITIKTQSNDLSASGGEDYIAVYKVGNIDNNDVLLVKDNAAGFWEDLFNATGKVLNLKFSNTGEIEKLSVFISTTESAATPPVGYKAFDVLHGVGYSEKPTINVAETTTVFASIAADLESGAGASTASNVTASPAVNSNSDVQSILEDHENRIDVLAAGGADGNDFPTSMSMTGNVFALNIPNQTNPSFDFTSWLNNKGYLTSVAWADITGTVPYLKNTTDVLNGDFTATGNISTKNTIIRDNGSESTIISQNNPSGSIYFRPLGDSNSSSQLRISATLFTYNNNNIWHAGNDGSGSGLNADLLDGLTSNYFSPSTHNHSGLYAPISHNHAASNITSGTLSNARISEGNVTQHESALSISGSQITDNTINGSKLLNGSVSDTKLGTGINANRVGSGLVSTTEYDRLNGVTTNVQNQLDNKEPNIGNPSTNGQVLVSQTNGNRSWVDLPNGATQTEGTFTPTIEGSSGGVLTISQAGSYPVGYYIKTGKEVKWWVNGNISALSGTPSGNMIVKLNIVGITPKTNMRHAVVIGGLSFASPSPVYDIMYSSHLTTTDIIDFLYKTGSSRSFGSPYPVPTTIGGSINISGTYITD